MDKLEEMKKRLYDIANEEEKEEIQRIFAQEVEIPVSGQYDIESDPDWFDINDYLSE